MKPIDALIAMKKAIDKYGTPVCQETDPDMFFPEKGGQNWDYRMAKKLCQRCPLKAECLNMALANDEQFGIWGGLTTRERQRLRRK